MGNIRKASCECGYARNITIGGSRQDYLSDSRFPFYCKKCGLVEVNVRNQKLLCSQCQSSEITQYGKHPVSVKKDAYPSVQCNNFAAHKTDNLCPKCHKMTLVFESPHTFFD